MGGGGGISIYSIFIQLYRIFKPTSTGMKDWKFIENNETRVKQIFI